LPTLEERLEKLEARFGKLKARLDAVENENQAVWILLRNLYVITKPTTGINKSLLHDWIKQLRNEAPADESEIPPHIEDQILSDFAPHFEAFVQELIERVDPPKA
jgi:hypothetical protein